jgi:hypothetical protein
MGEGDDDLGHYIELDHDLEFDVYTSSVTGGSPQMQGETYFTKVRAKPDAAEFFLTMRQVMPIDEPVHHVGIENLYMTQPMPGLDVSLATDNYGNMAPAAAMHVRLHSSFQFFFLRDLYACRASSSDTPVIPGSGISGPSTYCLSTSSSLSFSPFFSMTGSHPIATEVIALSAQKIGPAKCAAQGGPLSSDSGQLL